MVLFLYRNVLRVLEPWIVRYLRKRALLGKEDTLRANERQGKALMPRPEGALVWCHAASVGESLSLLSVIKRLLQDYPTLSVMVTTGTVTSAKLMAERLPKGAFHQYIPVDHPLWVRRFLEHWKPDLMIWSESEFWPNILVEAQSREIPAVLLNARMSAESFRHWRWARSLIRRILRGFSVCLAQNDAEAERLRLLGAPNVKVSANLKYAAEPLPFDAEVLKSLREELSGRPLLLWASTHAGEEEVALRTHKALQSYVSRLLTIIVPRHPVRGGDVASLCRTQGMTIVRRSDGGVPDQATDIYVADTLGELGLFYRLCPITVMGGSFADIGGHNPIEPAQTGSITVLGPQMYNFKTILADFLQAGATVAVADEAELLRTLTDYFRAPSAYAHIASSAQALAETKACVVEDIMIELAPYLCSIVETGSAKNEAA